MGKAVTIGLDPKRKYLSVSGGSAVPNCFSNAQIGVAPSGGCRVISRTSQVGLPIDRDRNQSVDLRSKRRQSADIQGNPEMTGATNKNSRMRRILLRHLVISMLVPVSLFGPVERAESASSITYDVVFTDYSGGPALKWLANKGFEPQRDATNQNRIILSPTAQHLELEAKRQATGLLLSPANVSEYSTIRIKWGVDAFPSGASYAKGVRSEAIMVYVFFGKEKLPSGHFLVPDSPYFIGLFLSDSDPVGEGFKGRLFHAGGRYVCADRAQKGQPITTDFPIAGTFKQQFGQSSALPISAIGVSIDTENAKGNGVAKSFISEIELLK